MQIISRLKNVVKVFESNWDFILAFLIEDDFEGSCIVIDLETCAHGLFNLVGDSSYDDDLAKGKKVSK